MYASLLSAISALGSLLNLNPNAWIVMCFVAVVIHVAVNTCQARLVADHHRLIAASISLLARIFSPLALSMMLNRKVGLLLLFGWVLLLIWEVYTLRAHLLRLCNDVRQACADLCNAVRQACADLSNAVLQARAGHGPAEEPNGVWIELIVLP